MEIFVDVRPAKGDGKVKAYASVTLAFGADGQVAVEGFSVIQDGTQPAWVAPPARKGTRRYFPTVTLTGQLKARIERAILAEYERQVSGAKV